MCSSSHPATLLSFFDLEIVEMRDAIGLHAWGDDFDRDPLLTREFLAILQSADLLSEDQSSAGSAWVAC